ncbi:MAG: GGDEF domain-containing protein [Pseudomonadales bacterium]|nr:GGDEF domain-containing protein [Pseudomonadales bacterium]
MHKSTLQLRRQADIDNLTKLLNRRAMNIHIHQEHLRSIEVNSISTLVMIDLDNFKLINDEYGHDAGDLVLIHVANVLKDHLRDSDYLSRRGGEEFLGLLVGINPYQAQEVIGRALAELNREAIIYNDKKIKVSFSAGISELNESVTVENAIQEADKQMYIAKKMGKNTIVSNNKTADDKRTSFIAVS